MNTTEISNYGFLIERTHKEIKQHFQRLLNDANSDITVDQWVVLDVINRQKGCSQQEIAKRTFKDAPTVTRILDLLEKKELIIRISSDQDRRRIALELTPKGSDLVNVLLPKVKLWRQQGWETLNGQDFHDLVRILETISHNFYGNEDADDPDLNP